VVNEVPVKELLQALARDTKQNIDIHPSLDGRVSLNAINEPLPAILDRIANQVDLRYRTEGNTIIVSPDTPYMKTYVVNYVNIDRKTVSTTAASGQVGSAGSGSGGAGAPAAGGAGSNASSTSVTTNSVSDFWKDLRDSVTAILTSSLYQRQKVAEIARNMRQQQEQEAQARRIEAASKSGQAAPGAVAPAVASNAPVLEVKPQDVIVNAVAGTITVNGNESQHKLVQEYLTKVETGAQRQVLIEATIVEVTLADAYQGGVDWSRLAVSGGFSLTQKLLTGFGSGLPTASTNSFQAVYTNPGSPIGNISSTIKLLDQFGSSRVLSSPKLMVLNNQTALLKAVNNIVYFEVQTTPSVVAAGGIITPPTINTTAKTVSIGVVMGVTPQVNEDGRVTLIVRPTISSLIGAGKQDPNPALVIPNIVPEIQIREMESVLQVGSGQTVILGGLMQDSIQRNRENVPGAGNPANTGVLSELFGFRNDRVTKSELVIFIRPTVIVNPTLESDELKFYQRFLPQQSETPVTIEPRARTGATK